MDKRRAAIIALGIVIAAGLLVGGYITSDQWVAVVVQGMK